VRTDVRRDGKAETVLVGVDPDGVDTEKLVSDLQSEFACDGALGAGSIRLQGDYMDRIGVFLRRRGFTII
jgi:translation initiation factor 1 (eIF-1/SUI1)